jgi:hypothetical protein
MGPVNPLGDWTLSLLATWQRGEKFTWTGGGSVPGVLNNVSSRDSWDVDLRITKDFEIGGRRTQFFLDIFNVINRRELLFTSAGNGIGFIDGNDQNAYFRSLHLPESSDYTTNIPGSDKIGEYRDYSVPFQPMERVATRESVTDPQPGSIYWESSTRTYLEYQDGQWLSADQGKVDQTLEDKAYIDMPNQSFLTFLNPRDIYFGIRVSI